MNTEAMDRRNAELSRRNAARTIPPVIRDLLVTIQTAAIQINKPDEWNSSARRDWLLRARAAVDAELNNLGSES